MDTGRCKGCDTVIYWARTAAGKAMPLDPAPDERMGNVLVDPATGTAYVFGNHESLDITRRHPGHPLANEPAYTAHHFTCTARGGPGAQPRPAARPAAAAPPAEPEQGSLF